jgi:hypothetical protein
MVGRHLPVFALDRSNGAKFVTHLVRRSLKLATVIAKIEFGEVEPESASLIEQPCQPTRRCTMGALATESLLDAFQVTHELATVTIAALQLALDEHKLVPMRFAGLKWVGLRQTRTAQSVGRRHLG